MNNFLKIKITLSIVVNIILLLFLLISCSDKSSDGPQFDIFNGNKIYVPADETTIQAAIESAAKGDIIIVTDGIYSGDGNRNLNFNGKLITLISENGAENTIIDCNGTAVSPQRAFNFNQQETKVATVSGFTIINGYANSGGAVQCRSSSPTFTNCLFRDNFASTSGGVFHLKNSSPLLVNCTFVNNSSPTGAGIFCGARSSPRLEKCIIAFSETGGTVYSSGTTSVPHISCCNFFSNGNGDWNTIEEQADMRGNFSKEPMFCNPDSDNFHLQTNSPCVASKNNCGSLIGALPVGCE